MVHERPDLNARIQDLGLAQPNLVPPGHTPIGRDEPVFLLRARDFLAPQLVEEYAEELEDHGAPQLFIDSVRNWAFRMREWQAVHGKEFPTTPLITNG